MLNNSLNSLIGIPANYYVEKRAGLYKQAVKATTLNRLLARARSMMRSSTNKVSDSIQELMNLGSRAKNKVSDSVSRLGTEAKDMANSAYSRASEGARDIMSTPTSRKQLLRTLKDAAPKGADDIEGLLFAEKYNAVDRAGRLKLLKDIIYENRINSLKNLVPTKGESIAGASGLGVGSGLGYLLGSDSDDSE